MRPLSTYLEYLLMTEHYAFLPGVGGFVLAEHEATTKSGLMFAPGRIIQFNRFMTHDNGMLANVIMEDTGKTYEEASQYIRHEVALLLDNVQHNGHCTLGHLGQIFCDEECHIAFRSASTQRFDPQFYGHDTIKVRPWQDIEREKLIEETPVVEIHSTKKQSDVIILPKYWVHRAAVAALIICFFFANLVTTERSSSHYHAQMFNAEEIIGQFSTLESQSWDEKWESSEETSTLPDFKNSTETAIVSEAVSEQPLTTVSAEPLTTASISTEKTTVAPKSNKTYYIIIASTTDTSEAQRMLKRFARKGYNNVGIIERDGRFRLYLEDYSNKESAIESMEKLRQNELFENCWILPVKNNPTSSVLSANEWTPTKLIIKEKDNDHFTMELSHLNKPAEKDQG